MYKNLCSQHNFFLNRCICAKKIFLENVIYFRNFAYLNSKKNHFKYNHIDFFFAVKSTEDVKDDSIEDMDITMKNNKKEKSRARDKLRNILLVVTPSNECVGIKLKLNDGKITESEVKNALHLKIQLENGNIQVCDVQEDKIILNPDLKEERMDQIKLEKLICKLIKL